MTGHAQCCASRLGAKAGSAGADRSNVVERKASGNHAYTERGPRNG